MRAYYRYTAVVPVLVLYGSSPYMAMVRAVLYEYSCTVILQW